MESKEVKLSPGHTVPLLHVTVDPQERNRAMIVFVRQMLRSGGREQVSNHLCVSLTTFAAHLTQHRERLLYPTLEDICEQ